MSTSEQASADELPVWQAIVVLAAAKAADSLTTLLALGPRTREFNPLVRTAHETFGRVPGEVLVAVVTVAVAIAVVEVLTHGAVARFPALDRPTLRVSLYSFLITLLSAVALHNLTLIQ